MVRFKSRETAIYVDFHIKKTHGDERKGLPDGRRLLRQNTKKYKGGN